MFKKSRSKVLVDEASEEEDMWHYDHCYKVGPQPLDPRPPNHL